MNRPIAQREAQDFVDRDIHLHVVRGGQWSLVAQIKRVAVLVAVAVFAVDSDPQAAGDLNRRQDLVQSRQYLFEGDRTGQREVQVFREPIFLEPAASQGNANLTRKDREYGKE